MDGALQLHRMRPDGTDIRQITRGETFATTNSWSPDGRQLAYECREGTVFHVCVINVDGSGRRIITP